jgi:hypothetical protein
LPDSSRRTPPDWLLVLLLAAGIFLWQRTVFPIWMVDVFPQQLGSYFWKHGEPQWMYTPVRLNAEWVLHRAPIADQLGAEGDPGPFFYPPFVAAALAPFADAPAVVWRDVLFGLNILVTFVFAWLILRLCDVPLHWRPYLWALTLVLLTYPLARAAKLGQIVPWLAALLWMGLLALRRGLKIGGVLAVALVGAIKLFPFALIALPLIGRKLRLAVAWVGAVAGIFAVSVIFMGLQVHSYWWEVMREFSGLVQPFYGNQSPLGWFMRLVYRSGWLDIIPYTTPLLTVLKWICALIFIGGSLLLLWRIRDRIFSDALPLSAGILLASLNLTLPVMWEHYWLFVLPALGWAIHIAWRDGDHKFWQLWLAASTFFFTMKLTHFYGDTVFGEICSGSQTVGMLLLWIWFVRRAWLLGSNRRPLSARELRAAAA